jgi:hypothetical protein
LYKDTIDRARFNQMEHEWEHLQEQLPGGPGYEELLDEDEYECSNLTLCERKSCRGCPMNR